jgi:hypothetical protein
MPPVAVTGPEERQTAAGHACEVWDAPTPPKWQAARPTTTPTMPSKTVQPWRVSPRGRRCRVDAKVRRGRAVPLRPTRTCAAGPSPPIGRLAQEAPAATRVFRPEDHSGPAKAGRRGGGVPPNLHAPPPVRPHRRWRAAARARATQMHAAPRGCRDRTRAERRREGNPPGGHGCHCSEGRVRTSDGLRTAPGKRRRHLLRATKGTVSTRTRRFTAALIAIFRYHAPDARDRPEAALRSRTPRPSEPSPRQSSVPSLKWSPPGVTPRR